MSIAYRRDGDQWVVIGMAGTYQKVTQVNAAPWVTINETMPIFEIDPDRFTIDNNFIFWDRVLIQPVEAIAYMDTCGENLLTTNSITFKFDATISIDMSPVSIPLYSNYNNPTVVIT